ncbi:pyridoxamine-phosphate oxidase [Coprinopsis cinerea okayama7|uniref:pyridoxal 5'-phosphate synthase n=1 Tax=Coprinopsis cinerea (strain Okayama-7 / 130 / ATCC MYA-4618 / FGSC 9003) TaxID=240176 RepID=A8NRQ6_COPC7|nr:pyridoxamine-phosphate oxidase [Coprinopsis cinerea okayama7\|eukprot:XP_001835830.2 pyridoxamine-phosphate oxidase [Coprinopsis cinerea okayama7\
MNTVLSQPAPDTIQVVQHQQYQTADHLTPTNAAHSPLDQFRGWFKEAVERRVDEPEAVTLATATANGIPSARVVLFKQVDHRGFVFFTNYTSRKSKELDENPHAALAFYWREVHRSVRVIGRVERLTKQENDEYFQSRPVGSRLGAWASKQSTVIQEDELEARLKKVEEKFGVKSDDAEVIALYTIFVYDWGDHEHVFMPPRRWLARLKQSFFTLSPEEEAMLNKEIVEKRVARLPPIMPPLPPKLPSDKSESE